MGMPNDYLQQKNYSSDSLKRREISGLIARLLSHYWTADDDPALRRTQAEDWLEDLAEFEVDDVRGACAEWRRSQTRRPVPADIRALAIAEQHRRIVDHQRALPRPDIGHLSDDELRRRLNKHYGGPGWGVCWVGNRRVTELPGSMI